MGAGDEPDYKRAAQLEQWIAGGELAARLSALAAAADDGGDDAATARAILAAMQADLRDLVSARSAILRDIQEEQDTGKRILTLAGGKGWGDGRRAVGLNSGGMGARAAR